MTQTHDRKVLIVAAANSLTFIDVERATSGHADPVVGRTRGIQGAFKISVSPDDKYLFVPQIGPGRVAVFDLERARRSNFSTDALVPSLVPTGQSPITTLASPDGRYLFSTNNVAPDVVGGPLTCFNGTQREGGLQVIDVQKALTDAATATIGWAYPAGCGPNAMALSPDGTRLSNTAADNIFNTGATPNFLAVFDATPVREGKPPKRLGSVPISKGPVSLVDTGTRIIVGFQRQGESYPDLMVIDPSKVAAGSDAIVGTIRYAGGGLSLTADRRTLIVGSSTGIAFIDWERVTVRAPNR
jgi:DNA-binding beta-propeller fold protein YncE